jgi:beta-barrel assembly-enhancing protease
MKYAVAFVLALVWAAPALGDDSSQHAKDVKLSQNIYKEYDSKHLVDHHSPYDAVLQSVGARISRAAAPHWFTERFVILKAGDLNAYATPGGIVFVNSGLLSNVDNVDELANVLGHETAHLTLGHLDSQQRQAQRKGVLYKVGHMFVNNSQGAQLGYKVGTTLGNYGFLNYTRQQEYAADQQGVRYAARAGFNPWGSVWFFDELERTVGDAGYEQYVERHPSVKDRTAQIEKFIKQNPRSFGRWSNREPSTAGLPRS